MSIATFSLPVDIPWTRIAYSEDMMDLKACDRELPPRWRSSVAVFEYQPPEDQQRTDGFLVSYIKVACSITGFQQDGKEIRIRERLGRSGWTNKDMAKSLAEDASKYYPCYGAVLEVVVAPHPDDKRFGVERYPYFADFDPKKRELYDMVTETGETMSRSLEDVSVRLGQTTSQSHEVRDATTVGGSLGVSYGGVSASGSVSNESSTTDLTQQGTENIRTTDGAREARETFSHTTQLSQMYHQLNSYHLGSNRAAFFLLPRPHTKQAAATFVNGPREIEGIQEFMLIVIRPKEMEKYCVEAYLETAHLTGIPIPDWGRTETNLNLHITTPDTTHVPGVNSTTKQPGMIIDTDLGGSLGGNNHGPGKGYKIISESIGPWNGDYTFTVGTDAVTATGWVEGYHFQHPEETIGCTLDVNATVYLKKSVPGVAGYEKGLMITGRAVCSCKNRLVITDIDKGVSVVFEKSLSKDRAVETSTRGAMSLQEANQIAADIKRELLQSFSSPDRYPRGTVSFLDTQLFSGLMADHIRHADTTVNTPLSKWPGIDEKLTRRVLKYAPHITRAELLRMPLAEQVESFGITFDQAVVLRRSLADLAEPQGPPPVPEIQQVEVPLLTGLLSYEAQSKLQTIGLALGTVTVTDSPLPANSVIEQQPAAGTKADPRGAVSVSVASGLIVRLPELVGMGLSSAMCQLQSAGLRSEPSIEGKAGPGAEVFEMEPPAGTRVTPKTEVTLWLKTRKETKHK